MKRQSDARDWCRQNCREKVHKLLFLRHCFQILLRILHTMDQASLGDRLVTSSSRANLTALGDYPHSHNANAVAPVCVLSCFRLFANSGL